MVIPQGCKDSSGILWIDGEVGGSGGGGVADEHALPCVATINGAINATIAALHEKIPGHRREDAGRVAGVDHNPGDASRIFKSHPSPGFAAIAGAVKAAPPVRNAPSTGAGLACTRIEGPIGTDGKSTDRLGDFVRPCDRERAARVGALPHSAGRRGYVDRIHLLWIDCDVQDTSANVGGADERPR